MLNTFDLHKDLVEVLLRCVLADTGRTLRSYLFFEHGSKSIDPETYALMANIYAAFMKKVFDIPQRKRNADIQHQSKLDDLW